MKNLKLFPVLMLALLAAVTFASCSDDDDEGGKTDALRGSTLLFTSRGKEYVDGECVGKYDNFQMDWFSQLFRDGTVYNQSDYASAIWKYDGDDIVVTYFDSSGNVAHTQRFIVEEVRADIGVFVVRLNLNEEGTHYYRIPCQIDSEKYDDVDNPDWWWAEWE